jgi:hypothetical protein
MINKIFMKFKLNKIFAFIAAVVIIISTSGCVEHRYYREHHEHSPEYIHRHQPRVDVDIHN